ncbi:dihydrofolate reductase [Nocardia sp. NBC_01503]|uniref:dihydrofolate reductase family protein n=1 Tax=Nocardia sp. NBC_01503 TaxID=2975997 RepID=UPI002E7AF9C6|nr:dihydrofolate reductase [Nocardia sp. NBC_01503]WTL34065.1 dihydrofolate reductase [Nocardia sp. NBC_01503]
MRKLAYYVGVSLDGYISGPKGEADFYPVGDDMVAWMSEQYPEVLPTHVRKAVGVAVDTPNRAFDTILMGRSTYDPALELGITSPYEHMKQYVFSRTLRAADYPGVEITDTDPVALVRHLKTQPGLDIWLCGGGNLASQLIDEVDRLIIKSYPVIAGSGIAAFSGSFNPRQFKVTQRREFLNGAQTTWLDRA